MENTMTNEIKKVKNDLIAEIDKRIADKIIEKTNADLLKKLIKQAETINEAIMIAELGTTYKRTGFHFDKRLEKMTDTIKYFKKNEKLSFTQGKNALTHKLIIGDNYDALQNLLIEYRGKIDVIYIDPPYGKDSMGEFAKTNYENAITRDNLLSMLYPRLVLARQLLNDNGVIFCSIDDKNQAYVKGLFDEVFGESSFVTNISVQLSTTQGMKVKAAQNGNIVKNGEYILCYSKDGHQNIAKHPLYDLRPRYDEHYSLYLNDNGEIGQLTELYDYRFPKDCNNKKPMKLAEAYEKSEEFADIVRSHLADIVRSDKVGDFKTTEELKKGYWKKVIRNGKEYLLTLDSNDAIRQLLRLKDSWGKTDGYYQEEGLRKIRGDWWEGFYIDMGNVAKEGDVDFKNSKKPVRLIRQLIKMSSEKDSIILDFFAGSGTTGQAVIEQNKDDSGKRMFILATSDEKIENTPNGIGTDITATRLKNTISDNLDVYDIATVAPYSEEPFTQIDETLYGKEKLGVNEKIKWVCENFEGTQKTLKDK